MNSYEYCIYCIINGGTPFIRGPFTNLADTIHVLENLVTLEKMRNRYYYVDNDFFENEYHLINGNGKYFCIKQRRVTDWVRYNKPEKRSDNNIYYL